jgi:two-component system, NtrC family, response regulator AtoC
MKILIVDDERNIRESMKRLFALDGIDAETASDGLEATALLKDEGFDAVVLDLKMPGMGGQELLEWIRSEGIRAPVIMISALGDIRDAVTALKSGASDYLLKPFDPTELVHKIRNLVSSRKREDLIEAGARTAGVGARLVGESAALRALKAMIDRVAPQPATVLITGESGTGKEVVAREIHARSPRVEEPFVAVNIGGIHAELMESELFGHERGAFTGAESRKLGLFELAGAGTLFLDEIGEMPLPLQVKLLRVLQERKIRRLGGNRDIPIDARIISATNRDIDALVREGRFRDDLFYRLNVVRIAVPSLRERAEDIPLLAGFLLERIAARMGKPRKALTPSAIEALSAYPFPGNIRELENVLERAMIYCEGEMIETSDLDLRGLPARAAGANSAGAPNQGQTLAGAVEPLEELERKAIIQALAKWHGNRTRASLDLGISRRTILNKIKRYGL